MHTSHNLFNTGRNGRFLLNKPNKPFTDLLKQTGEGPDTLPSKFPNELVGYIQSATNGNIHRHDYHHTIPSLHIYKEGERPNSDIMYEYTQQFKNARVEDFPTNHNLDLPFLNVYQDGTPMVSVNSDILFLQKQQREDNMALVQSIVDKLQSSSNKKEFVESVNKSIDIQQTLLTSDPEMSSNLANMTKQIIDVKGDAFYNKQKQERMSELEELETQKLVKNMKKTDKPKDETPKTNKKPKKLDKERIEKLEKEISNIEKLNTLKKMTKPELKQLATEKGLKYKSKATKQELIDLIYGSL